MIQTNPVSQMAAAFARLSPRLSPRPVPLVSRLISAIGPIAFLILIAQTFLRTGLASWSVGIAYILYDTGLLAFTALNIRGLAAPPAAIGAGNSPAPRLTAIVAAYNEAQVLGITIDTLARQEQPPELILLADDGSTDNSAAVLAALYGLTPPPLGTISEPAPQLPSLRWLRLPHGGKAVALNAAFALVETELVLTVDADTLLAPGALLAMRAAFAAEPELVAATGVLRPICGPGVTGRLFQWFQSYEYVRNFLARYGWMRQQGLLLISGAFAGFRRAAVVEVGGFDPESMVEDYELIHRLYRHSHDSGQDWRVRVIGQAIASTDAPASPLAFLRQRRRWFGGFLQTQHWNRDMVGNARYGQLGTRMLPVKALDTVQPVFGLAAFIILLVLLALGRLHLALPILAIMAAKIVVDLTFHLWSLGLYKRWTGQRTGLGFGAALLVSLAEPFCFQLLRHAGAIWGWYAFLSGRGTWNRQQRTAIGIGEARTG
jgi:cellulose synthase/poly-beta-1,6-N-acetylglucosamine synthase-like glycosyltransferase